MLYWQCTPLGPGSSGAGSGFVVALSRLARLKDSAPKRAVDHREAHLNCLFWPDSRVQLGLGVHLDELQAREACTCSKGLADVVACQIRAVVVNGE